MFLHLFVVLCSVLDYSGVELSDLFENPAREIILLHVIPRGAGLFCRNGSINLLGDGAEELIPVDKQGFQISAIGKVL